MSADQLRCLLDAIPTPMDSRQQYPPPSVELAPEIFFGHLRQGANSSVGVPTPASYFFRTAWKKGGTFFRSPTSGCQLHRRGADSSTSRLHRGGGVWHPQTIWVPLLMNSKVSNDCPHFPGRPPGRPEVPERQPVLFRTIQTGSLDECAY